MKKLMRSRDRILLLLAYTGDILSFLHYEVGIGQTDFRKLYGWMPEKQKRKNFREVVRRMLKTGYLEKIIKNGKPYLRITGVGENKLIRDFPILDWQRKKWDKKWRMVVFDIKELQKWKRESLRTKLKELGFAMFQKSIYLTPFDVASDFQEFIEEKGFKHSTFVLEVSNIAASDAKILAQKIWPLKKINKNYQALLEQLQEVLKRKDGKKKKAVKKLKDDYFQILLSDPCLPKELLPKNWAREVLEKILTKQ